MRRRRQQGTYNAGFTLVEALIATALMGAILAALATVSAQWLPNWNRGLTRLQRVEHLALGLDRLVADLAASEFITAGRDTVLPFFDGAELSVTFVRTALGPNASSGLEVVRIAETGSERGPVLVRTRAPFVPIVRGVNDGMPLNFSDPVVLARLPYRISFAYAGADRAWKNSWRDLPQLPTAIRITVRDAANERTLSASTATRVHAELQAECILVISVAECWAAGKPKPPEAAQGEKTREL